MDRPVGLIRNPIYYVSCKNTKKLLFPKPVYTFSFTLANRYPVLYSEMKFCCCLSSSLICARLPIEKKMLIVCIGNCKFLW